MATSFDCGHNITTHQSIRGASCLSVAEVVGGPGAFVLAPERAEPMMRRWFLRDHTVGGGPRTEGQFLQSQICRGDL